MLQINPETESYLDRLPFSLADRPHHILHVHVTVIIHNRLPNQNMKIANHDYISPGELLKLYECNPNRKYEADIIVSCLLLLLLFFIVVVIVIVVIVVIIID